MLAHDWAARIGHEMGDSMWPGFRPDTIPVIYVLPGQGTLLVGWTGDLPAGYTPVVADPANPDTQSYHGIGWHPFADPSAASYATSLGGRNAAQVVVHDSDDVAALVGGTAHEAFHVFERASRKEGQRFGEGENAFLVTSYPVFDTLNETLWALEGRVLAAAWQAKTPAAKRALVRQFLAVREARQRALATDIAEFEQLAELNEGLAEYSFVRAVQLADRQRGFPDHRGAVALQAQKLAGLRNLIGNANQSIRLRFYQTGPAMGALLDALAGPKWKSKLVSENLTLQDALADASGYRQQETALRRQAETSFGGGKLRATADSTVSALRARRQAQADSVLATPGVQLIVTVEQREIGLCGIDPQNLLQVSPGVLLHTRWVVACAGDAFRATFNTPVVQDQRRNTVAAVAGADSTLKLTFSGDSTSATDVRLESPVVSLRATRAAIAHDGRALRITVKP